MELTRTRLLFTAAPLLLLAGTFAHPEEPTEAAQLHAVLQQHRTSWLLAHALLLAGVVVLGPVLLRLASTIRPSAPRLSLLSAVIGVAATGAAAAFFGGSLVLAEAGRGGAEMVALLERVLASPVQALSVLVPGMLVAIAVTTSVLAVTGVISRGTAAMATVGFAAGVLAPEPFACLALAVFVAAMWRIAGAVAVEGPAAVPVAEAVVPRARV